MEAGRSAGLGEPGQPLNPGSGSWLKALISFGVPNHHHGINNTQFIAQSSWVAHRGLKYSETAPECPEENPQSTPLAFANNCAFADLNSALKITRASI